MSGHRKVIPIVVVVLLLVATPFLVPRVIKIERQIHVDAPAECVYAHVSGFILQKKEHVKTWHPVIKEMQSYSFSLGTPTTVGPGKKRTVTWDDFGGGYYGGAGSFYQWRTPGTNDIGKVEVLKAVEPHYVLRQMADEERAELKFWFFSQFEIEQSDGGASLVWKIRPRAEGPLEHQWTSVISAFQMRTEFEESLRELKSVIESSSCSSTG